jgi:hypothetical protein
MYGYPFAAEGGEFSTTAGGKIIGSLMGWTGSFTVGERNLLRVLCNPCFNDLRKRPRADALEPLLVVSSGSDILGNDAERHYVL